MNYKYSQALNPGWNSYRSGAKIFFCVISTTMDIFSFDQRVHGLKKFGGMGSRGPGLPLLAAYGNNQHFR